MSLSAALQETPTAVAGYDENESFR